MKNLGRIDLAAARDGQSIISHVNVRTEDGKTIAEATNGYMMARREVTLEYGDELGLLPSQAVKEYGRSQYGKKTATIKAGKETIVVEHPRWIYSKVFKRPDDSKGYPPVDQVFEDNRKRETPALKVQINAERLYALAQSLNSEGGLRGLDNILMLEIPIPEISGCLVVDSIYVKGEAGEGLIMPVRG
jgi:DNA polymerase III sliding clamp (beta) subunit (PCNA family)